MYKRKAESQAVPHEAKHVAKKQKEEKAVIKANGALVQKALQMPGPGGIVWLFGTGTDWVRWRCLNKSWRVMANKMNTLQIQMAWQFSLEEFHEFHVARLNSLVAKANPEVAAQFNVLCRSCKTVFVRNQVDGFKCYACEARDNLCARFEDDTCQNRDTAIAFCRALVRARCKTPSMVLL
jgi:hypothetical protein